MYRYNTIWLVTTFLISRTAGMLKKFHVAYSPIEN